MNRRMYSFSYDASSINRSYIELEFFFPSLASSFISFFSFPSFFFAFAFAFGFCFCSEGVERGSESSSSPSLFRFSCELVGWRRWGGEENREEEEEGKKKEENRRVRMNKWGYGRIKLFLCLYLVVDSSDLPFTVWVEGRREWSTGGLREEENKIK